jgi:hypothetical protein
VDGAVFMTTTVELEKHSALKRPDSGFAVPVSVSSCATSTAAQPVTIGIPFAKGQLAPSSPVGLRGPDGESVMLQTLPLARWSDGSVKWLLLDFVLPAVAQGCTPYELISEGHSRSDKGPAGVTVEEHADHLVIATGRATFRLNRNHLPIDRAIVGRNEVLAAGGAHIELTDRKGRKLRPQVQRVTVEPRGPVRATVRYEGTLATRPGTRFVARLCFFAQTSLVRLRFTIHNPNRARHRGGLWDLGDAGSVFFRDLSVVLRLNGPGESRTAWTMQPGDPVQLSRSLDIFQASSGGANWQSSNHVNSQGRLACPFQGYRVRRDGTETFGQRAQPVVTLSLNDRALTAAVPEFWQQFPKALGAHKDTVRVALFPEQYEDGFELQGGEQKTHTVWLSLGTANESPASLEWTHQPVRVQPTPEYYAQSGAIPYLVPDVEAVDRRLRDLLADALEGPTSFFAGREKIDEYGWRNYGEIYADHEAAHYAGRAPVISHYNNQYDFLNGALLQYFRTGDSPWLEILQPLARHVIDIDIYHTTQDKAAYNNGLFWHTDHYKDAASGTHRSYSRVNRKPGVPYGGGPGNAHNYTTGLLHYYYATGDESARDAVHGLADWVVNMDDGAQNIFGWIDDGPSGLATYNGEPLFNGPGRGSGNSLNALIDGWLLTGHRPYLQKAETLIRRVIHPADDISARDLLNVEPRWSYTVFLSALARYLEVKAEMPELDFMYAYARESLLHYAKWMLQHERTYLEQVEKLEYPTETWAAQDFRKANVLRLATAHVDEPLRSQLLRRGHVLADRAWTDLLRFESRNTTRPRAILMIEGTKDLFLRAGRVQTLPAPTGEFDFGKPQPFAYQKDRIRAQLRTVSGALRALLRLIDPRQWWRLRHWPF